MSSYYIKYKFTNKYIIFIAKKFLLDKFGNLKFELEAIFIEKKNNI
jgi:hypothetical protein